MRDALVDWHEFLRELEDAFDQLDRSGSPAEIVERGAPVVFDVVVNRTGSEDAWYGTYERSMSWLAETVVYDVERMRELVNQVVGGSFRSWIEPTPAVRDETFLELAVAVETLESAHVQVDGLSAWLAIRADAFVGPPRSSPFATDDELRARDLIAAGQDGHERFIAERDAPRDAERAVRLTSALVLSRDAARHDLPLAFDLLAEWQAVVLGASSPIGFREATAYAKRGRERYPVDATTQARFEHLLGDAGDRAPIAVRAARAYLDVCFFHPFSDGNARAARLAVDHVLAREGLALRDARGIFTLSRAAGDARSAWSLAKAIDRVAGPRQ
ncbi:MAG: Fic family protein [Kofleriaceae bacterium]